jgi:RNA recognition motif-containing protein
MNAKLYVGNLSYAVTNEQLGQLFSQAGTVLEAIVVMDKLSGRSKGFGFVTFGTQEEADQAMSLLNETDYEGRKLIVNPARPQAPRENRPYKPYKEQYNKDNY